MPTTIDRILKTLLIVFLPLVLILGSARLLATDAYLAYEYGKASFPPDLYGFTDRQRFILASTNIHYVRSHLPDDELSEQTLKGVPVYNPREVLHMADVRAVFQSVMGVWQAAVILAILMGSILSYRGERKMLAAAIRLGGLLTSAIVLIIGLLGLFAWQFWFEIFHLFFFQPGSWLFSYSDTLIRLFPVEFWFDATLAISILSLIGGWLLVFAGSRWSSLLERTVPE